LIDWNNVVIPKAIELARDYCDKTRQPPTLRALFYMLVSRDIIPNTLKKYQYLSRKLVDARKNGIYPYELLIDKGRSSIGGDSGYSDCEYDEFDLDVGNFIKNNIDYIMQYADELEEKKPRKWLNQPNRVFIVIEKESMLSPIYNIVKKWNVKVYPLSGYGSLTFRKKLYNDIRNISPHAHPVLLFLTDFDPTGEDIVRFIVDELGEFGLSATVEKIAVNREHIEEYKFPHRPEDETEIRKMRAYPRYKNWIYGLYRVELDAFVTLQYEALRDLLNDNISKYFDDEIREDTVEEFNDAYEGAKSIIDEENEKYQDVYNKLEEALELLGDIHNG
jgi:hypothetical protein